MDGAQENETTEDQVLSMASQATVVIGDTAVFCGGCRVTKTLPDFFSQVKTLRNGLHVSRSGRLESTVRDFRPGQSRKEVEGQKAGKSGVVDLSTAPFQFQNVEHHQAFATQILTLSWTE